MQTRSSDEISVCLSVRPSVKRVGCDKTNENQSRFLYHANDHSVWFCEKKKAWWGWPILPEILGQPAPVAAKSPILNQ